MRRIFLREDWIGYPMRKDYDMNSNPLRMDNEENADMTDEYFLRPDGTLEGRKKRGADCRYALLDHRRNGFLNQQPYIRIYQSWKI